MRNYTKTTFLILTSVLSVSAVHAATDSKINAKATNTKQKAKSHHKQKEHVQKKLRIKPVTEEENAWFANIETDAYRLGAYENATVGYSAANGWDFSVSLINTQILGSNKLFEGLTFFNIAKTVDVTNDLSITIGSQNGTTLANAQPQLWYNYTYLDNDYDVTPWLAIHGGPYLANAVLTGTVRQIGFLAGAEIKLIPDKLALQMDYISGHQSLSGATINLLWNMIPWSQLYLGVLVPERNSGNEFAGVIGFNFSTKSLYGG